MYQCTARHWRCPALGAGLLLLALPLPAADYLLEFSGRFQRCHGCDGKALAELVGDAFNGTIRFSDDGRDTLPGEKDEARYLFNHKRGVQGAYRFATADPRFRLDDTEGCFVLFVSDNWLRNPPDEWQDSVDFSLGADCEPPQRHELLLSNRSFDGTPPAALNGTAIPTPAIINNELVGSFLLFDGEAYLEAGAIVHRAQLLFEADDLEALPAPSPRQSEAPPRPRQQAPSAPGTGVVE